VVGSGRTRTIRVSAPAARRVEVRSDATGWRSVDLVRRDDEWEATIPLGAGTHRVMVRIDDGEWSAPGNLPVVDDDFGGRVGLLVVP
jgi:1,4-alpha-glucan branching enzyme